MLAAVSVPFFGLAINLVGAFANSIAIFVSGLFLILFYLVCLFYLLLKLFFVDSLEFRALLFFYFCAYMCTKIDFLAAVFVFLFFCWLFCLFAFFNIYKGISST